MTIPKAILNPVMKRLKKEIKDDTGYEISINFREPIRLKVEDGGARLTINVETMVDANLLSKLLEELKDE